MKKYIFTALVILSALILYFNLRDGEKNPDYRTVEPEIADIEVTVSAAGEVRPRNRLEIKPPVSGRLEEVLVSEGDAIGKGEVIAWMSSAERAALLDTARSRGEEELERWEEIYRPTPIIAPLSGFIIRRDIQPGQSVGSQDAVLVMADDLIVQARVDETDMGKLERGQRAAVTLDAFPQREIIGEIEHIAYESEVINNVTVYKVDIIPMEEIGILRSGMSATADIILDKKEDALTLDSFAVTRSQGSAFVTVKGPGGKPETREVKTGLRSTERIEIVSGLSEDETVIVMPPSQENNERGSRRFGLPGMN